MIGIDDIRVQGQQLTFSAACHRCHPRAGGPQGAFSWDCRDPLGGCQRACCLPLKIPLGYQPAPGGEDLGSVGLWGRTALAGIAAAADAPAQAVLKVRPGPWALRPELPDGL